MKILAAALFLTVLPGVGGAPNAIQVGDRDLQQVIDAAPPHSVIVANSNREIEIARTITIDKPLTLVGINARLQTGLAQTPILSVLAEGVRIRDFRLTGNANSVTQEGRAPLIEVRRSRFVIENGETNNSSKDGVMITPLPEYGDIEHGVVRNITSRDTIRDTVSIAGVGEQGLFVRHVLVENIRSFNSEMRGPVEVSDGSEYITVRDVYAESCYYGVDVQDHGEEEQVNRHVIIDGLHVKKTYMAVRTANHDFGHDGLTIRNVTGSDWPADAEVPFRVRNTSNVLIENVRLHGCPTSPCMRIRNSDNVTLRDISFVDSGHDGTALGVEDSYNVVTDNVETVRTEFPDTALAEPPPNIVIILSDDQSWPHASAYGDVSVRTPAFDRIAEQGVLFNHAFVGVPSCSPSRAAILTGRNQWELGSASNLFGVFSDDLLTYTRLLFDKGYQVAYSEKGYRPGRSDVTWADNPAGDEARDFPSFFENRDKTKPFAYWMGSRNPHRPYEEDSGEKAGIDPAGVKLPPHLPDSPEVRSDVADYYLEIQRFDDEVGEVYDTLERGGVLDNTLVVVTSDNGMPFPRGKTNLYDGGVRVPMAVMWPANIPAGRVLDDFVNTADLAPTFLEAAGIDVPDSMTGKNLLGILESDKQGLVNPAFTRVYLGRERHTGARDENHGYPMRALRNKNYLYIWNIHPNRWPAGNPDEYADIDDGPTKSWLLANPSPTDKDYFQLAMGIRPEHELYDLRKDPGQVKNAAYNPAYKSIRNNMRQELENYLTETGDLHLSGDGKAYEDFPLSTDLDPGLSYVEPTEAYVDELTGEPIGNPE